MTLEVHQSIFRPGSMILPAFLLATLLTLWTFPATTPAQTAGDPFRIGFTSNMFNEVNENDARAALTVWGETIARGQDLPIEPGVVVSQNVQDMLADLQDGRFDLVAVTTIEYVYLRDEMEFAPIFLTYTGGETAEEYVVLAHRDGPLKTLSDLAGRNVRLQQGFRASLAPLWLDTLLVQEGLAPLARLAGEVTTLHDLSQVLLPVFFHQADACLVTRHGFETMAELNPQIGTQLRVLASSERMVPNLVAFRHDYAPPYLEQLLGSIRKLHETPAGRQVLLVFNSERSAEYPESALDSALELIDLHRRIVLEGGGQ
ncbi:MAG: hypothetical protein EA399_15470 [Desulfovibrionales bacterium]|nr:MAG: hypothetical protein EA399_15470 [Desulfovibrionales bacterium]